MSEDCEWSRYAYNQINGKAISCLTDDDEEGFRALLAQGADIKYRNSSGETFLHLGAARYSFRCMRYLMASGADVNAISDNGMTPLFSAVALGGLESIRFLFENGADASIVDNNGRTAAEFARERNQSVEAQAIEDYQKAKNESSALNDLIVGSAGDNGLKF